MPTRTEASIESLITYKLNFGIPFLQSVTIAECHLVLLTNITDDMEIAQQEDEGVRK
jgi:hypothetical protein